MKIEKEILARLEQVYAVNLMNIGGEAYCVAASEGRGGKMLRIHCKSKRVQVVEGLAGGVMCLEPIPEEDGALYAIQKFYPVFQSRNAQIVKVKLPFTSQETIVADVRPVLQLPYVHRIHLMGAVGDRAIIAATLCASKQYEQDWSSPGDVRIIWPGKDGCQEQVVLTGIHKNHGMYRSGIAGGETVLVSGEQGVFEVSFAGGEWRTHQRAAMEVSDVLMYDVDRDGREEMVVISPFHGNELQVLRLVAGDWKCIAKQRLAFGHAVWAGEVGGKTAILTASRGGDKAITLHMVEQDGERIGLKEVVIDRSVGAANIAVENNRDEIVIYAANHGANEVARYTVGL